MVVALIAVARRSARSTMTPFTIREIFVSDRASAFYSVTRRFDALSIP
jgi:hypothetical protein